MDFTFRPLMDADLLMLHEWLGRSHLRRWWADALSVEEVRQKYLPRIEGRDDAHPYVAFLGDAPVGYIQWYSVADGNPNWWPDNPGAGVIGIDQFLADPNKLGQGLGTAMITQFIQLLMWDPGIHEIRVDPRPDNQRAIGCYRKVGFQEVGPIITPDGPAILMTLFTHGHKRSEK